MTELQKAQAAYEAVLNVRHWPWYRKLSKDTLAAEQIALERLSNKIVRLQSASNL